MVEEKGVCIKNTDKELALKTIEYAKVIIDRDPHLANYMLRDLKVTKDAKLDELSWAMHKEGACKNDVLFLIEQLEKYISGT